jgi:hypothetical protein
MKESVKCDWKLCCHGLAVASTEGEGCYAGDVTNPACVEFMSDEEWSAMIDRKIEEYKQGTQT